MVNDALLFSENYKGSMEECLLISFMATLAMTLFSSIYSYSSKKNFLEPSLLAKIINYHLKDSPKWLNLVIGYFLHFLVGILFTAVHVYLYLLYTPVWYNAVFFGIVNGIIGALVWYMVIKIYQQVLHVAVLEYLFQLILAHIVFALTILYMYILPR
jgi:hypothetical protein